MSGFTNVMDYIPIPKPYTIRIKIGQYGKTT